MIGWFIILSVLDTAFFSVLAAMYFVMHDDVNTMRKEYLELMAKMNLDNREICQHNGEIIAEWRETIDTLNDLLNLIRQTGREGAQE